MDPHEILGVPRDATLAQIQDAYRQQAAKVHPDRGGDAREFAQAKSAYQQLIQVKKPQGGKPPVKIFACPECDAKVRVPQSFIGRVIKCPKCENSFKSEPAAKPPEMPVVMAEPTPEQEVDLDLEVRPIGKKYRPRRKRQSPLVSMLMIVFGGVCAAGIVYLLLPILRPNPKPAVAQVGPTEVAPGQVGPSNGSKKNKKIVTSSNQDPANKTASLGARKPNDPKSKVKDEPTPPSTNQKPKLVKIASGQADVVVDSNDDPNDFRLKAIKGILTLEPVEETELSESLKTLTNKFEALLAEAMEGKTTEVQKLSVQQQAITWLAKELPRGKQEFLFPVIDVATHPTKRGVYLIRLGECETENGSFPATLAEPSVAVKLEAGQAEKIDTDWKMSFTQRLSISGKEAMVKLYETGIKNLAIGLAQPEKVNRKIYKLVRPKKK